MRVSMKHKTIHYSMLVLLIGSVALTAGRANAQGRHRNEIIIESFSWGIAPGQTARTSLGFDPNFTGGVTVGSARARIQLLDAEGEVVAQSEEMRVERGKMRFWDVPRELLPAGEPTGRIQVRARILVAAQARSSSLPLAATVELIDTATGRTEMVVFSLEPR